jgi:hypothetical protein
MCLSNKIHPMLFNRITCVWLLPVLLFLQCSKSSTPQSVAQKIAGEYSGLALYIKGNVEVYVSAFCQPPVWGPLQSIAQYSTVMSVVNDSTVSVSSQGVSGNFVIHENGNFIEDAKKIISFKIDTRVLKVTDADSTPASACTPVDQYYYVKQEPTGNPPVLKFHYYSIRTWNFEGAKIK